MSLTPSLHLPTAPRWVIYAIETPVEVFTVLAVKGGQVIQHTGIDLGLQFERALKSSAMAWPIWARWAKARPKQMWAAWVLPDVQVDCFEWACLPTWGPDDIDAECRLEASARSQIPVADLALDFKVHRTSEGQLWAKVWHCSQAHINALKMQTQTLNLSLKLVTVQSQAAELENFLGIPKRASLC